MDAFFASVETVRDPSLSGKPVIVGGRPNSRGVVSTCSYEARAFGVHSAMSLSEAHRRCPHGIFLDGDFDLYREFSEKVMSIFYFFTPYVEAVSIDEAYLDISHVINETPVVLAKAIKKRVVDETRLNCSVGIASNKLVAKIASSKSKPNGLLEVIPGTEPTFLAPLSIQSIPGIGTKTQEVLNHEGIKTIADLQMFSQEELIQSYGASGYYYHQAARGQDNRPVAWENVSPKSIGAEIKFSQDQSDFILISAQLKDLLGKAYRRLRAHKMRTRRVSLKLRFKDFKTISRSHTLSTHINEHSTLETVAFELLQLNYKGWPPLRLIGVSFEQLTDGYWQPTFW